MVNHVKTLLCRSQRSQWKENHTVAALWKPIRSGLDRFLSWSLQRKLFSIIREEVFKPANCEALDPSLKLTCFGQSTSVQFPAKTLMSSMYQVSLAWIFHWEILANSAWFYTILYFGKRGRENQRAMKPGDLQLKTTISGLKSILRLK